MNIIVNIKYKQPKANTYTKYSKIEFKNYNFNVKNTVIYKDTLRLTLTADLGIVMLEGEIFKEKSNLIFAIDKGFTKFNHLNNKQNPRLYKIDDEFVYDNLNINKSTEKEC